ncbi:Transferase [Trema orientale]|uniref:Transferase n=1 Tax=Trema orientale TaxID=63057 RepID=A0A2P5ARF4_TREOI|nr:Transferase [Trema orientale]
MAQPNAVEIVEVCMVAPPPPAATPDHSSTSPNFLPLTFFDMQWIRLTRFQRLYFYQTSKTTSFSDSILPRLKHSLSLTLLHYFPLAGNITWPPTSPKPVVVFAQGDAVSVTVAKSNADFYRLSGCEGNELWDATEYHHLLPKLAVSHEQAQVLTIQITFFPESGGFSIGIVANHGVVDGKSLAMFTKSWAHICRSLSSRGGDKYSDQSPLLPPELTPLYDRTLIEEPAKLQAIFSSNQWLNRSVLPLEQSDAPDSVRGTFRFSRVKIEELRRLVLTVNQDDCARDRCLPVVRHLSAFSLTCAYTWVCLVKAEGIDDDNIVLVFPVECRFRLDPPIAMSYFGNCSGIKFVVAEREALLGTEGFVVAVNAISEAIRSLENNIDGVLSESENQVLSVISSKSSDSQSGDAAAPERRVYSAIESNRFDVYGTDFGWGRPKKVEMATGDGTGAMNFADSRDGDGGVEIGIVLKKQHMETFVSLFAQGLEEKTA